MSWNDLKFYKGPYWYTGLKVTDPILNLTGPIQCTDEAEGRRQSTGKESKVKVSVETDSGKKIMVTVLIAENEE